MSTPSPEHRKGTDPGTCRDPLAHEIGTVTGLSGDATVWVSENAVIIDGPVTLLRGGFLDLLGYLAEAGWEAARNERCSEGEDGGNA